MCQNYLCANLYKVNVFGEAYFLFWRKWQCKCESIIGPCVCLQSVVPFALDSDGVPIHKRKKGCLTTENIFLTNPPCTLQIPQPISHDDGMLESKLTH